MSCVCLTGIMFILITDINHLFIQHSVSVGYVGPANLASVTSDIISEKSARILDAASGTGLVGEEVKFWHLLIKGLYILWCWNVQPCYFSLYLKASVMFGNCQRFSLGISQHVHNKIKPVIICKSKLQKNNKWWMKKTPL